MNRSITGAADLFRHVGTGQVRGIAVLLNLHNLPHAGNPLFRQAIVELIDSFARQYSPEIIDIGSYVQIFLFAEGSAEPFIQKLQGIGDRFAEQHVAAPRFAVFRLPQDTGMLVGALRQLLPHPAHGTAAILSPAEAQRVDALHRLAAYENILGGADLSAVVRESPVWKRDGNRWTLCFSEVTVALDSLEKTVGIPLRHDPWLLQQIAPLLDRRIIRHFMTEPSRLQRVHSLNLMCTTVTSPAFRDFVRDLSFGPCV